MAFAVTGPIARHEWARYAFGNGSSFTSSVSTGVRSEATSLRWRGACLTRL